MNNITELIKSSQLEESTALVLSSNFLEFETQASKWLDEAQTLIVTSVEQKKEMKLARETRLKLRDVRVSVEKTRKNLKEDSLRYGKAIDAVAKLLKDKLEKAEAHLQEQEDFIKIQEAKEREELRVRRTEELSAFNVDCSYIDLANMNQLAYEQLLNSSELAYHANIEAEKRAEEERIEREQREADEQNRLRLENEKLRKEAEERERIQAEERRESERKMAEEREQMRIENEKRIEEERERFRKAEQERIEKERIQRELESQKTQLNLPNTDTEKIQFLLNSIQDINVPTVQSQTAQVILDDVQDIVDDLVTKVEFILDNL